MHSPFERLFFFLPLMPFASQIWSAAIYRRFSCVFWIQTIQSDDESSHSKSCEAKPLSAKAISCLDELCPQAAGINGPARSSSADPRSSSLSPHPAISNRDPRLRSHELRLYSNQHGVR